MPPYWESVAQVPSPLPPTAASLKAQKTVNVEAALQKLRLVTREKERVSDSLQVMSATAARVSVPRVLHASKRGGDALQHCETL